MVRLAAKYENEAMTSRAGTALAAVARSLAVALSVAAIVAGCGAGPTATPVATPAWTPTASAGTSTAVATDSAVPSPSPGPTASSPAAATSAAASGLTDFRHVYVIVMENKSYRSIVGSASAPYLNSLIARYGSATNLRAETHPSEPNYIALVSGGLQGVRTDGGYTLKATSLFDQIEAAGRTWHVYAQGYPGHCFKGSQSAAVVDGPGSSGQYVRKHNPAISFAAISGNPTRCARITKLGGFDPAAADFEMIIPNQINDMHSSSVRTGDNFLRTFVPKITGNPAFAGSLLVITWDEGAGSDSAGGGGHIATIIASPGMKAGSKFTAPATHYSLLRTIELAWGLPLLGGAATASTVALPY